MIGGLELGDVYSVTIERIKAQDGDKSRLGMAALMWISHAERPLRADELCHALAVELGSTDFDSDNLPSVSTLVTCCQGLIILDKEASIVRLIHFTLQEYLSSHPDIFSRPHSTIAEICLTYLNSQPVKALSAEPFIDNQDAPFLEYCSLYWGVHAKRELSDCARSLALNLLKEYYDQTPIRLLLEQVDELFEYLDPPYIFSGLHCSAFLGIGELVTALVEIGCYDINEVDSWTYTPLTWAARNGHDEVVKILLEQEGVSPEKADWDNRTPLSYAACNGHQEVVKILLAREEVGPDKPDNYGRTPLSHAAETGHEGVMKILLAREEVNPDEPDDDGGTPLSLAAWSGHEGAVEILLAREEVNPDEPDDYGQTPLSFAAKAGREGVMKILLARKEANPDKPDNDGRTPLSWAAWSGHEGAVEILLEREEVNPETPDIDGQTPLSLATSYGHRRVVSLLQSRQAAAPSTTSNLLDTAL